MAGPWCRQIEVVREQVCASVATVREVVCDRTEVLAETVCDTFETIDETVCDQSDQVSETVCDSWRDTPLGGLFCWASHTVSRTVCTASHVVSRAVCTSSHATSNVVCAASHVVETAVCTSSRVVASAVCIVETIYLAILGPRPPAPETQFIVHSEQSLETVTALVERHLGPGWQVDTLFPQFDPERDLPQLAGFYRVRKATALDENPFDVAYRLRDAAGFLRVDPDLPYTRFMGGV